MKTSESEHEPGCIRPLDDSHLECPTIEHVTQPIRIGASMLVGYIRHAWDTASRLRRNAVVQQAFDVVARGLNREQIIAIATEDASLIGYHDTGYYFVEIDEDGRYPEYDPAVHVDGPVRLK